MPIKIEAGTYCTSEETATLAGLSAGAVKLLLRQGSVAGAVRVSERCWLVPLESAEALKGRKVGKPLGYRKTKVEEQ